MVIEQLTFRVPEAAQAAFLAADAAVWTPVLAAQPGFGGKEVWREAGDPQALRLIIRWHSRAAWHAVPQALLRQTDAAFCAAVGAVYPVQSCVAWDVL